jgi:hypothetical protein
MKDNRVRIIVVICVIVLCTALGSVAWAGKPQTYHTEYGYAMLTNSDNYVIWNDGAGQYADKNKGGKDLVELEIYDSNKALRSIHVFLGKPELPYRSPRKVEFLFPIRSIASTDPYYNNYLNNRAVYDILKSEESYLNGNIIHADITAYPGSKLRVQFVVDPGCTAEPGAVPPAITQAAVDAFYTNDANPAYWTAKIAEPSPEADAHDHIIYTLYYDLPFAVTGTYPAFTITNSGSATLGVGRLKGGGSGAHDIVYLAKYTVPFQLTVTALGKLGSNAAPKKYDTVSTTWGDIKR